MSVMSRVSPKQALIVIVLLSFDPVSITILIFRPVWVWQQHRHHQPPWSTVNKERKEQEINNLIKIEKQRHSQSPIKVTTHFVPP